MVRHHGLSPLSCINMLVTLSQMPILFISLVGTPFESSAIDNAIFSCDKTGASFALKSRQMSASNV